MKFEEFEECPICNTGEFENICNAYDAHRSHKAFAVNCQICGEFSSNDMKSFADAIKKYTIEEKKRLSAIIRRKAECYKIKHMLPILIITESIENKSILDKKHEPKNTDEAIDCLLKYIKLVSIKGKARICYKINYPICYSSDCKESLEHYVNIAKEEGYIRTNEKKKTLKLTLKGERRLDKLRYKSNQAFVAMSLAEEFDEAWEKGFSSALKEEKFIPIRSDTIQHNEKICNKIEQAIRNSGLLIADFTQQRSGVFFEAGFAKGLGIEVIWTCKKEDFEKLKNHFDTRQYNHIIWTDAEDLRKKLIERIQKTINQRNILDTKEVE